MSPSPVSFTFERASEIVNIWRFSGNEQFLAMKNLVGQLLLVPRTQQLFKKQ